MVSLNKISFENYIICFVFLSVTINLGKCLQQNNDTNVGKHIKSEYKWNVHQPDLKTDVPKTWLKFDKESIIDNSKAEEMADPRDPVFSTRRPISMKKIDLSPPNCGLIGNTLRIVNGRDAPDGGYPWIVVIIRFGRPLCAGTIVNRLWVVTAAHCFMKNNSTESLFIRIGTNKSNKGIRVKATKIFMHPRFNIDNMYSSDLSLIRLAAPINISQYVRPICLPHYPYSEPFEKNLMVAGWGAKTFISTLMPIQLQEISLPIISVKQCRKRYEEKNITIFKSQICTWANGKDACRGDSGGPAVQYSNGRAYLVGLVSYGIACADRFPGIFTKLSYFLQWIKYTISTNTKKKKIKLRKTTTTETYNDVDNNKKKKKRKKRKKNTTTEKTYEVEQGYNTDNKGNQNKKKIKRRKTTTTEQSYKAGHNINKNELGNSNKKNKRRRNFTKTKTVYETDYNENTKNDYENVRVYEIIKITFIPPNSTKPKIILPNFTEINTI